MLKVMSGAFKNGKLGVMVSVMGLMVSSCGLNSLFSGSVSTTTPVASTTEKPKPLVAQLPAQFDHPISSANLAPGSNPSVLPGPLLIADRSNNRLLVVSPKGQILWKFPRPGDLAPGQSFLIPDDAFFTPDGKYIIATEEDNFVVSVISIAQHKIVYRYGTPGVSGMGPNQLWNPDDAMMLPDGFILVPDIKNCRLVLLKPGVTSPVHVYGLSTNACFHSPPQRFGSPNGAFPMSNGHYAVTEINGDWIDEMNIDGTIYQSFHAPGINYPSDTNEIRPGVFLTADYSNPGTIETFTSTGQVIWRYSPQTGPNLLNQPSLALPLPNGDVVFNNDKANKVEVVDPRTNQVVWQYGTGVAGSGPGQLSNPDGLDLAPPYSLLVQHASSMGQPSGLESPGAMANGVNASTAPTSSHPLSLSSRAILPQAISRTTVVSSPQGATIFGGLDSNGSSVSNVWTISGTKQITVRSVAPLASPTHDAGSSYVGGKNFIFGGGQSTSISTVQSYSGGKSYVVSNLPLVRSDLVAASYGGAAYLVGGYDGNSLNPSILRTTNGTQFQSIGQLIQPVRYPAAVALAGTLYVFGGEAGGVPVTTIESVDLASGTAWVSGEFNTPLADAAAAVVDGRIYIVGGVDSSGSPSSVIYQYNPKTSLLSVAGHLPKPLSNVGLASYSGRLFVIGGESHNSSSNLIYEFSPSP